MGRASRPRTWRSRGPITGNYVRVERDVDEFTQSFEVAVYTGKAAKQLQDARSQYLECKRHLGLDPANATVAEELETLRAPLAEAFGADAWFLA
jgi:hypothetical protein